MNLASALRRVSSKRRLTEFVLLIVVFVVALIDANILVLLVGLSLLPIAAISLWLWWYLRGKAKLARELGYDIPTFYLRAMDAGTLAIIAVDGAILGMIVVLRFFGVLDAQTPPRPFFVAGIGYAMVLVVMPALGWLQQWHEVWLPEILHREQARRERPEQLEEQP